LLVAGSFVVQETDAVVEAGEAEMAEIAGTDVSGCVANTTSVEEAIFPRASFEITLK